MFSFAPEYYPLVWAMTAASIFLFMIMTIALRKDIVYTIRKWLPTASDATYRPPRKKSLAVWALFWVTVLSSLTGMVIIRETRANAFMLDQQRFIPLPTPLPSPTPQPEIVEGGPLRVSLRFPADLDPCNVDVLTIIPENVDPYELPLVYPIEPWFENHQFVKTAFAELRVNNRNLEEAINLSNKVIAKVIYQNPLPGPVNAAFTLCDVTQPRAFPSIEIGAYTRETALTLGDNSLITMEPLNSQSFEVKLVGVEPGLYEVLLGVEYEYGGEVVQAWAEEPVYLLTPEVIKRWSAGVITYWGDCHYINGEYICEETELVEPVIEPAAGEPAGTVVPVCTMAPPNRLEPGSRAEVSRRMGLRLRIRETPGLEASIITSMSSGLPMSILDGPVCEDGYWWWNVQLDSFDQTGWMAEGEPRLYYLDPIP